MIVERGVMLVFRKDIMKLFGWGGFSFVLGCVSFNMWLNGMVVRFLFELKEICVIWVVLLKSFEVIGMVIGINLVN